MTEEEIAAHIKEVALEAADKLLAKAEQVRNAQVANDRKQARRWWVGLALGIMGATVFDALGFGTTLIVLHNDHHSSQQVTLMQRATILAAVECLVEQPAPKSITSFEICVDNRVIVILSEPEPSPLPTTTEGNNG